MTDTITATLKLDVVDLRKVCAERAAYLRNLFDFIDHMDDAEQLAKVAALMREFTENYIEVAAL